MAVMVVCELAAAPGGVLAQAHRNTPASHLAPIRVTHYALRITSHEAKSNNNACASKILPMVAMGNISA